MIAKEYDLDMLYKLKDYCSEREDCEGCIFDKSDGCSAVINNEVPQDWNIHEC